MKKQQEIKNLIDKSIGTKGSLAIPSFWMNKILKDVIDLSQENNEDDGGITIVDSVVKLDPNAKAGSLASVVKSSSVKELSFRDLYQPDASMLDQEGVLTAPELLSSISSIKIFAPLVDDIAFEPVDSAFYIIPRDMSMTDVFMAMVQIVPFQTVTAIVMKGDSDDMEEFVFAEFSNDTNSFTINSDQVDAFNTLLANGMDWCYFGCPDSGFVITEEQFATIDLFVKAVTGSPSKACVYLKNDKWEELHVKDFEKLASNISKVEARKADKVPIKDYLSLNNGIKPNVYTTYTIDHTGSHIFSLADITDPSIYNEYIIEIKCTATPSEVDFRDFSNNIISINWANDHLPIFEEGYTYIISIVNNFGVFAQFDNS